MISSRKYCPSSMTPAFIVPLIICVCVIRIQPPTGVMGSRP